MTTEDTVHQSNPS